MTLVIVPCWWDASLESLSATIQFQRPDLICKTMNNFCLPISVNPPRHFFPSPDIPGIGEVMLASFPEDPSFEKSIPPNTWWMGEKYDGIRCSWNPHLKRMYSRTGKEISFVPSIVNSIPKIFIDGELWFGRGKFSKTYVLLKSDLNLVDWNFLRLLCFDVPGTEYQRMTFESRYEALLSSLSQNFNLFSEISARKKCKNGIHASEMIQKIIDNGGEGLILRKFNSLYHHGKSLSLLKLKTFFGDREAIVVAIEDKSVKLKLPTGETFSVEEKEVKIPLSVGNIVSFSFENFSRREIPVSPSILRIRNDLSWEEVVVNYARDIHSQGDQNKVFTEKPHQHWTTENMKQFLENFAKERNMNPHLPETWHSIPYKEIAKSRGGRRILQKFKGHFTALQTLFPDIGLSPKFFVQSWSSVKERRKFFENYATENRFDALVPQNWYNQSRDKLISTKGMGNILSYHDSSIVQALLSLFPDLNFDKSKLSHLSTWHGNKNRRKFFIQYAQKHCFDPRNPEKWYSQSNNKIMAFEGAEIVMRYYGNSVSKALLDLFPDIGLDKDKLRNRSEWYEVSKRKEFFIKYAKEKGFDHLNPLNWYSQTIEKILETPGAFNIIYYHNNRVQQALVDLFPNIGLDITNFSEKLSWQSRETREKFFLEYAAANQFDYKNVDAWYSQTRENILSVPGAHGVVYHHNGSIGNALVSLFPQINFDASRFSFESPWRKITERRRVFSEYAVQQGFDPWQLDNWSHLPKEQIMSLKGAREVVSLYKGSLSKTLRALFASK